MNTRMAAMMTALCLTTTAVQAGENTFGKEEGFGMLSGAAAGALVGGPVGAAFGLMLGGVLGDSMGLASRAQSKAQQLEHELTAARAELASISDQSGGDAMLQALAQQLHADVLFRTGAEQIDAATAARLEQVGRLLATHPNLHVELHGFADPRGQAERNLELSLRRATAVREALMQGGVAPEQIFITAHGEDLSTAPMDDVEAYAWERRVSLSLRPSAPVHVASAK